MNIENIADNDTVAGLMAGGPITAVVNGNGGTIKQLMEKLGVNPEAPAPQPSPKPRAPGFSIP